MAAAWAWSYGPMSKRLKRNFLFSTEYNLMFNKILKENMWLKARKKSLLRISCLFKVFPWRPKTLRMFFLNEPLICLVCKDPWSPGGWNHWDCFSQRKQMFRGQYKTNLFLYSSSLLSKHEAKKEYQGLSDLWGCSAETPPCRFIWFVLQLREGRERWVHFKNLWRVHLPVSVQIPLIAHVSIISALPANKF